MRKKRTILVVDDEEADRSQAAEALQAEGYDVLSADCYRDALAVFENNPGISFLVADVALPDGNGCALATAIHQRSPKIGVLFISGHVGGEACRYYGLDVSDRHFLQKPFAVPDLVAAVKRIMRSGERFPNLYVPKTWSSAGD